MSYRLRYSAEAREDLTRLYDFLLQRDVAAADKAVEIIIRAINNLREFPFTARRAPGDDSFLRELVIPFGSGGYVALFAIEDAKTVTILAVRHQREDDYH
ncbi:type II toxin-antitoxin system RelE/ParE family toxin [Pseudorhizobium endolithicum]|uniref:Type II toxin-antitoxin system RelE/ParE family toxin n=1 Tax=Pseudorhizobium endolithicum TaxID=1191678 RepID=A0ABM8PGK5_9HYPH|nr:type II toxin-antitoxin system RelE/ParE family toxin [Pseudorhizobium endolithicum]CAD7028413.1 type II toxin-antitoxin system RelE/ParE family toxin [Pseudorhizobium endolithicum]